MAREERRYPRSRRSRRASPDVARVAAKGGCFPAFSRSRPSCEVCGLDYAFADAGDGPAVLVTLFAGFIVLGIALAVEIAYEPPLWVYAGRLPAADAGRVPGHVAAAQGLPDRLAIHQQGGAGAARSTNESGVLDRWSRRRWRPWSASPFSSASASGSCSASPGRRR